MAESVLATALSLRGDNPEKLPLFEGSLTESQLAALAANQDIFPEASAFAADINAANIDEMLKMLNRMIPGYSANLATGINNASALMRGELPADVQRNIADWAAQRGISSGTTGSQFSDATELWKYGISTLEGQQRGLGQFLDISARSPKAPLYDFTSMFISPGQHFASEIQKYQTNLPVMQFNNWVDTLPSNIERAAGQFLDWVATQGTSVMSMYTGGMMGGGGGGGGGGMMGMMGGMGGGGGGGSGEASTPWSGMPDMSSFGQPEGYFEGSGEGGMPPSYVPSPYFG